MVGAYTIRQITFRNKKQKTMSDKLQQAEYGYLCLSNNEYVFVVAKNISDCVDRLKIISKGGEYSVEKYTNIPIDQQQQQSSEVKELVDNIGYYSVIENPPIPGSYVLMWINGSISQWVKHFVKKDGGFMLMENIVMPKRYQCNLWMPLPEPPKYQ